MGQHEQRTVDLADSEINEMDESTIIHWHRRATKRLYEFLTKSEYAHDVLKRVSDIKSLDDFRSFLKWAVHKLKAFMPVQPATA